MTMTNHTRVYQLPEALTVEAGLIADEITQARGSSTPKWGQKLRQSIADRRDGVIAEFAIRWVFKMPTWNRSTYPPFEDRNKADIGDNCDVRQTNHPHGRLLLHQDHDIERDYALVVFGLGGQFRLPGWIPMSKARDHWYEVELQKGRPCMAVNQEHLYPIEDLVITEKGETYTIRKINPLMGDATTEPCLGCGRDAAPIDGYCGTCWFEYVYRPRKFGHVPGGESAVKKTDKITSDFPPTTSGKK